MSETNSKSVESEEVEGESPGLELKDKQIFLAVSAESLKYGLYDDVFLQSNERFHGVFRSSYEPKKPLKYKVVWTLIEITHPEKKEMNKICFQNEREFIPNPGKKEKRLVIYFYIQNSHRINLPIGNYKVDVFIEDTFQESKKFQVVSQVTGGLYLGTNSFVTGEFIPERCFSPYISRIAGHFYFSKEHLALKRKKNQMVHYVVNWERYVENDRKIVHEKMVDVKPEEHTAENILMFAYKNPGGYYEPGVYVCSVSEVDGGEMKSMTFKIMDKKPEIFLGTIIDNEGRIIDDRQRFPGNVTIVGLCSLDETMMENNGKLKFCAKLYKLLGEDERKLMKIVSFKSSAKEKREVLVFEFDQTKEIYPPGVYEVKVITEELSIGEEKRKKEVMVKKNDNVIASRVFQILHRFDMFLTTRSGKNRKEIQHYPTGSKYVNYHLRPTMTGKFRPSVSFTACVIAIGSTNLTPGTVVASKTFELEVEEEVIKRKMEVKLGFPVGRFELRIFMAGLNISSLFFNVFPDEIYEDVERKLIRFKKSSKKK